MSNEFLCLDVRIVGRLLVGADAEFEVTFTSLRKSYEFSSPILRLDMGFYDETGDAVKARSVPYRPLDTVIFENDSFSIRFITKTPTIAKSYLLKLALMERDEYDINSYKVLGSSEREVTVEQGPISVKLDQLGYLGTGGLPIIPFNFFKAFSKRYNLLLENNVTQGFLWANRKNKALFKILKFPDGRPLLGVWSMEFSRLEGRLLVSKPQDSAQMLPEVEAEIRKAPWIPKRNDNKSFAISSDLRIVLTELANVDLVVGKRGFTLFRGDKILKESPALPAFEPMLDSEPYEIIDSGVWCGGRTKHDNIYHSMLDDLARGWLVEKNIENEAKFCFYDYSIGYSKFAINKIFKSEKKYLSEGRLYRFNNLKILNVSTSGLGSPAVGYDLDFLSLLRSSLIPTSSEVEPMERIYVCRRDAETRKMSDDLELEDALLKFGFRAIVMTDYTPEQQIFIFSRAKFIVAQHGAALTNLVFCSADVSIVEIFSPYQASLAYVKLASLFKFNYRPVIGERFSSATLKSGWRANVDSVVCLVESMLANSNCRTASSHE